MSDTHLSQLTFDSLSIPESLKRGIAELGFTRCTPIQAQTLPLALAGRDVAGQAQTGTGKTAAFLIALYNRLLTDPGAPNRPVNAPRAIVIAPTRELAVQIHSDALGIGKIHRTSSLPSCSAASITRSSGVFWRMESTC